MMSKRFCNILTITILISTSSVFAGDFNFLNDQNNPVNADSTNRKFRGHWVGIEFGLNNYVSKNGAFNLPDDIAYMSLNPARSWELRLNFPQYSASLSGNNIGFLTGLGFEFCNYRFENNQTIINDPVNDVIIPLDTISFKKSKLSTSYLTIPLLFEYQFPKTAKRKDRMYISAGVIGGILLSSNTKTVHWDGDEKIKEKIKRDQHISPLKYGLTLRFGIKRITFYTTYSLVPLFRDNKGPELYPVSFGIKL